MTSYLEDLRGKLAGAVDAAIIWDSTVPQFKELEAVEVPELTKHRENASAAVVTFTKQPQEALKFARYLSAPAAHLVVKLGQLRLNLIEQTKDIRRERIDLFVVCLVGRKVIQTGCL